MTKERTESSGLARACKARARPIRAPGTLAAALVLFAIMMAHAVLETARDALFLARLGPGDLAMAYAAMAALALVVLGIQRHVLKGLDPRRTLIVTLLVSAAVTAVLAGVVRARDDIVFIFYIWTGVVATLAVPTFWLIAGRAFTVAQAKTSFALIGAGAALGAATGSAMAAGLAQVLPTRRLVVIGAALLVVAAVITALAAPRTKRGEARATRATEPAAAEGLPDDKVRRYLRGLALLGMTSTIALTLGDLAFKTVAATTYSADELATFFGVFYAILNVLGLVVQLVVAPWIVKTAGMSTALLALPMVIAIGSSAFALSGAFTALLVLKLADGGLRHSLHRMTSELLFLPITAPVRERFKAGIDVVSQRGGQALAAAIAFAVATFAGPRMLAALASVATVGWWTVAMFVRGGYFERFRERLNQGQLIRATSLPRLDLQSLEAVLEALGSLDEQRAIAALDLLEEHQRTRLVPSLVLFHPKLAVVQRALEILDPEERPDVRQVIEQLVSHPDPRIRAAALAAVSTSEPARLERALTDSAPLVRGTAAVLLGLGDARSPAALEALGRLLAGTSSERAALAHAIAHARAPLAQPLLEQMLTDDDGEVVRECAHAVERDPHPRFAPGLIRHLGNRDVRAEVRRALVAIGEPAIGPLVAALDDATTPLQTRRHIPRTLSRLVGDNHEHGPRIVQVLVERLEREEDGVTAYKMLRALGRLRHDHPEVQVDAEALVRYATKHAQIAVRYARWSSAIRARAYRAGGGGMPPGVELLGELVDGRRRAAIERVMRTFDVLEPDVDYEQISNGLLEGDVTQVEASRELIEHHLPPTVAGLVLAAIGTIASPLPGSFGVRYDSVVAEMLHDESETLRCIAAFHAAEVGLAEARPALEDIRTDASQWVRLDSVRALLRLERPVFADA